MKPHHTSYKATSQSSSQSKIKFPRITKQPQWLKDARQRLSKKTLVNEFKNKSKEAALQHTTKKKKEQLMLERCYTPAHRTIKASQQLAKTLQNSHQL